jgi:ribosomal protein S27E
MVCSSSQAATFYRPRRPRQSPLYRVIERYLPEFERIYNDRYERRYGTWRPVIGEVARKFLRCGDLHFGFARVRCPDCAHEMFVPFSCRQRCLCPSCHQKRTLLAAETIAHTICAAVPHRQLVFTIRKRLRGFGRYDRKLLGRLAVAAPLCEPDKRAISRRILSLVEVMTRGLFGAIQSERVELRFSERETD